MGLSKKDIEDLRGELDESSRPIIFFDDDADGTCSFLLFYRYKGDGYGVIVKSAPELPAVYARKIEEYYPDKVFILDKPLVEQEFLDSAGVRVVWLDHHNPVRKRGVKYYNPQLRKKGDNRPTSYWAYKVTRRKEDLWIAALGTVADWFMPNDLISAFRKEYPGLLPAGVKDPAEAIYNSRLGELIRAVSFNLKGSHKDTMQSVKILTRVESPYEVLDQTTPRGRFIWKRYLKVRDEYEELMKQVRVDERDELLVFTYSGNNSSFSADISNELLYRHPGKVIIVARLNKGRYMCSIRSSGRPVEPVVMEALKAAGGTGGGHAYACGANVGKPDWDVFVEKVRELVKVRGKP